MNKILSLSLLTLILTASFVSARTQYDSTGQHIIYDDTIRGQKRAYERQIEQQRKVQAAAAAKINYEQALKELENDSLKTNTSETKNQNLN